MYSINGVALDNPALGWEMLAPSVPLSALQQRRIRTERPGRDGVPAAPATRGPVTLKFTVRTPYANLSTLLALFSAPVLEVRELADPTKVARGGLASSTPELHYPRVDLYSHSFLVEIPEGCWRGTQETTSLAASTTTGVTLEAFDGMSAPVQDALVRLRGPLERPHVTDSSGAFLVYDGLISDTQFLRFDSDTGRAWLTTNDIWTGGTEVSGLIDYGGPRGVFEITPAFTDPADPRNTAGRLTLTQDSRGTGSGIQVRGRSAILI